MGTSSPVGAANEVRWSHNSNSTACCVEQLADWTEMQHTGSHSLATGVSPRAGAISVESLAANRPRMCSQSGVSRRGQSGCLTVHAVACRVRSAQLPVQRQTPECHGLLVPVVPRRLVVRAAGAAPRRARARGPGGSPSRVGDRADELSGRVTLESHVAGDRRAGEATAAERVVLVGDTATRDA